MTRLEIEKHAYENKISFDAQRLIEIDSINRQLLDEVIGDYHSIDVIYLKVKEIEDIIHIDEIEAGEAKDA